MSDERIYQYRYIIAFESEQPVDEHYLPIVPAEHPSHANATIPHGLMHDMVPALKALWYTLHLPRNSFDFWEVPASLVKEGYRDYISQVYMVASHRLVLDRAKEIVENFSPDIVFSPANVAASLSDVLLANKPSLEVCSFEDLSQDKLEQHWKMLSSHTSNPVLKAPPKLVESFASAGLRLPLEFIQRWMSSEQMPIQEQSALGPLTLLTHKHISTFSQLEKENVPREAIVDRYEALSSQNKRLELPLTLGIPGIPNTYRKNIYKNKRRRAAPMPASPSWKQLRAEVTDADAESAAVHILVTHRALASNSPGLVLAPVADGCFQKLAQLESCYEGHYPKPHKVWTLLREIGKLSASVFDRDALELLKQSASLTVFSNFPIGLAKLPGASAPLACVLPISYRPLLPLTRALPQEGLPSSLRLEDGLKVLIVECLDPQDPIFPAAQIGWDLIRETVQALRHGSCQVHLAKNRQEVSRIIEENVADVLLLSAHGFNDKKHNLAGICVGDDRILGFELGRVPPVVLFSSCHVAPRGFGVVSIADMLLRQGAVAVLGTQVPVHVGKNAALMSRFFGRLHDSITGQSEFGTLDRLWHYVMTSNAVNDIVWSSAKMMQWATTARLHGRNVLEEFMLHRSNHRLRPTHIYEDTVRILREIAMETGFGEQFESISASHGFLPESLFYYFVGAPDRVFLG